MKKLLYAIILTTVLSVSQANAKTIMSWNGQAVKPDSTLAIHFGAKNILAVSTDQDDKQKVIVVKSLPDGSSEKMTATLTANKPAQFEIGPMTCPVEYLYEHGMIFYRGYRIEVSVPKKGADATRWSYSQKVIRDKGFALLPETQHKHSFDFGWRGHDVNRFTNRMKPIYFLRLSSKVLTNQNHLEVQFTGPSRPRLLEITNAKGKVMYSQDINEDSRPTESCLPEAWRTADCESQETSKWLVWYGVMVDATWWPTGDYNVALWPKVGDKVWREGPVVNYRRRKVDLLDVKVSPYAP